MNWFDLPEDSPFTPVVRLLLVLAAVNVVFSFFNVLLNVSALVVLRRVKRIKGQTRRLLLFIKRWVRLGKEVRDDTLRSAARVEVKTDQTAVAVHEVPQKVVERIHEAATAPPSADGTPLLPTVVIPLPAIDPASLSGVIPKEATRPEAPK